MKDDGLTVRAVHPENGLDGIQPGEIYEKDVFTPDEMVILRASWRMQHGVIQDRAHRGIAVIRFIERIGKTRAFRDAMQPHVEAMRNFLARLKDEE